MVYYEMFSVEDSLSCREISTGQLCIANHADSGDGRACAVHSLTPLYVFPFLFLLSLFSYLSINEIRPDWLVYRMTYLTVSLHITFFFLCVFCRNGRFSLMRVDSSLEFCIPVSSVNGTCCSAQLSRQSPGLQMRRNYSDVPFTPSPLCPEHL
jgi:hypothetical protein